MRRIGAKLLLASDGNFLRDSYVEVQDDGTISAVVDTQGKLAEVSGLEFYSGILCPGFVNAHCHLELSAMAGAIEPGCGLPSFIGQVVAKRSADEDMKMSAMRIADRYMQRSGIVAVGDISNGADSFAIKQHSHIQYHTFLEVFGTGSRAEENFRRAEQLYEQYSAQLKMSIAPHAAYSVHPQLWQLIAEHSSREGNILSVHNQETPSENEMFQHRDGLLFRGLSANGFDYSWLDGGQRSSFQHTARYLPKGNNVLFVHNTFAGAEDLPLAVELFGAEKCFFVLCPLSNKYIEQSLPNLPMFADYGANVCIGTDSLASNTKLSILEELKCLQASFPQAHLGEMLQWATINGARALGLGESIGSLECGKRPGVLLLENVDLAGRKLRPDSTVRVMA